MGLKEMKDSDEFKEIFNHIQDIINEKSDSTTRAVNEVETNNQQEKNDTVTTKMNIKKIKEEQSAPLKISEIEDLKGNKNKNELAQMDQTQNISLQANQQVDLAALSKELDVINKRINRASVMTVEHEQFKENKLTNDAGENVFTLGITDLDVRTCNLCNNDIELEKNLSGLVVGGEFFACESCCKNSSNEDLTNWTKSKMKDSSDFQPIGLWVTREKNKKHRW